MADDGDLKVVATIVVILAGLYLVGLAAVGLVRPGRAKQFLGGFAASGATHYLEMFVRIMVGLALVLAHDGMLYSRFFHSFGWVLLVSSAVLVFIPWRLHRRFALWGVPYAVQYMRLVAIASLALGMTILGSILLGGRVLD